MANYPRIIPASDSAVLIEFGDSIDYAINARVYKLQSEIERSEIKDAVQEFIPSYRSLLVEYDLAMLSYGAMRDAVSEMAENMRTDEGFDCRN